MRTLTEFFRSVYVPSCKDKSKRTLTEYNTAVKLAAEILDDPTPGTLGFNRDAFVRELRKRKAAPATINKHIRHINAVLKQMGTPVWTALNTKEKAPKIVSDADFQALYRAFGSENEYPKHIAQKHRPHFWRTIIHFVAVTALRREAVLGIEWRNVNTQEGFLTVEPWIDKKNQRRFKPLTDELLADLLELQGFGCVIGPKRHCVFPWVHGQKAWYKVWNRAELTAGVKLGLHDLKRFSGELALRAGATQLELMQHMDHANIATTLKHYCRPKTTKLVQKMKVPIPMEFVPPEEESAMLREIEARQASAAQFLDEQRLARLIAAGIDMQRLAAAIRGEYYEDDDGNIWETSASGEVARRWKTRGNTVLSVYDGESEVRYA